MKRNQAIECLRIVSAFGIVWFHSGLVGHAFAYSGLIVFLILAAYYATTAIPTQEKDFNDRVVRLIFPWAFWFVIYAIANIVRIWALTAIHFMKGRLPAPVLAYGAAAATCLFLLTAVTWANWEIGVPGPQYLSAIAPMLAGVSLAFFRTVRGAAAAFILILVLSFFLCFTSVSSIGLAYLLGLAGAAFALQYGSLLVPKALDVPWLSNCMFGVYLVHSLFLSLEKLVMVRVTAPGVVAAFLLSTGLTWSILRSAPSFAGIIMFGSKQASRL
jgi:hypothetical protein